MRQVLLIEDCQETQLLLKGILGSGFQVTVATNEKEAEKLLDRGGFDLILLDVMLPDTDGFRLCARARADAKWSSTPIIFITGKHEINDKLLGFSLGADDYVVKPFEPLELKARIEARVSRVERQKNADEIYWKGELRFSLPYQKVFSLEAGQEKELNLTPTEFKLLYFLARNEGRVYGREQLLNAVWGSTTHVVDRTVDTHVYTLRRKLESKARYIESVPGSGYRFAVERQA